jgi:hypothetical protein
MDKNRKTHYNKKGLYNGYDKNNKERDALDYYSTPTEEVSNILNTIKLNFNNSTILEPSAGGGHMLSAIYDYLKDTQNNPSSVIATDIKEREKCREDLEISYGKEYDFISDNYPITNIDYIIMNPPYTLVEPFIMKALGMANKGIVMLGRLQFLEGESRYKKILSLNPPSDVYVYVDRIACYKNGDLSQKISSAQAYAWFYWDLTKEGNDTRIHWIRRHNKLS